MAAEFQTIPAIGFGPIDESARTATLLEFNSTDAQGQPIDTSQRHALVRQLHPLQDADIIARYSDWRYVLRGKSASIGQKHEP